MMYISSASAACVLHTKLQFNQNVTIIMWLMMVQSCVGLSLHRSLGDVTPIELLSKDSSLGLPLYLGLEAPVMTPNGVTFLYFLGAELRLNIGKKYSVSPCKQFGQFAHV